MDNVGNNQPNFEQSMSPFTVGVVVYYAILFVIGMTGNISVITILIYIMKNIRWSANHNVFIYVLCLSGVDLLVIMLLPVLITDIIFSRWLYGNVFCKLYVTVESVNKTLSTFILAVLSFDRYLSVCQSHKSRKIRTTKNTLIITIILFISVIFLLTPVYFYAREVVVEEIFDQSNETAITVDVPKCTLDMSNEFMEIFSVYTFAIGFCLPSIFIVYFYSKILLFTYNHAKSIRSRARSQISVKRLTCATLMIVLFYFFCWTPYWIVTVLCVVISEISGYSLETKVLVFVHSLVYVNSAFNWVFYAYLNKNLRESREIASGRRQSSRISSFSSQQRTCGKTDNYRSENDKSEVFL